jgi:hypothetical protein
LRLFLRIFVVFRNFCEFGANFAEKGAAPSMGVLEATSGRSYGLGLRGAIRAVQKRIEGIVLRQHDGSVKVFDTMVV